MSVLTSAVHEQLTFFKVGAKQQLSDHTVSVHKCPRSPLESIVDCVSPFRIVKDYSASTQADLDFEIDLLNGLKDCGEIGAV